MPLYEYECPYCGSKQTIQLALAHLNDDVSCPECHETMHRVISCTNFKLKGKGWSKDGYSTAKDMSSLV